MDENDDKSHDGEGGTTAGGDSGSVHRPERWQGAGAPRLVAVQRPAAVVAFDRQELSAILKIYGRMVAAGEWRDYAIDHLKDRAVFSIFRRASEVPLYRVEKDPALARRQGAYSVVGQTGMILKRGHDLEKVMRVIDKSLKIVSG